MNLKWIFSIGIAASAIASLYFIIKLNLGLAVLSMMALFALTNAARAKSLHDQGVERESRWMMYMSIFFGVAFISLSFILLVK